MTEVQIGWDFCTSKISSCSPLRQSVLDVNIQPRTPQDVRRFLDKPVTNETAEHRRYPRWQLPSIKLVSLQGTGAANVYRCKDLGLAGMLLECSEPLLAGSVVRFAIQIGAETIRGLAAVRRTTSREMGLAYTSLKMEDRAKLRTFLDGLAARSKLQPIRIPKGS
jgi:PilZ domain